MPRRITSVSATTLAVTSIFALSACSMPGGSNTKNTASAGDKTFVANTHKINVPSGFGLYSDKRDGTTETIILINTKKMPTNINIASNPEGFKVEKWCNDMQQMFKKNFAPGADIKVSMSPKTGTKTECRITGHGKTANAGVTGKSAPTSNSATATSASSPTSSNTSNSASTITPGTPFSITANVKKSSTGAYVALMSRQLDSNYTFDTELKMFDEIAK